MIKRSCLKNIERLVVIALIVSMIAYVMYEAPEELQTGNELAMQEPAIFLEETDFLMRWNQLGPHCEIVLPEYTIKDDIVEFGLTLLETPYVYGGSATDGFDCSGYIYFLYKQFDIEVPRSTAGYEDFGTEIPIEDVEEGDLLLFLSPTRNAVGHIGMISNANGKDSDFIHSSSGSEMKVIISKLSNEGYTRRFVKAVRVL